MENEEHIEYITEQIKSVRLNVAEEVIIMPYVWEPSVILNALAHRVSHIEHCKLKKKIQKLCSSALPVFQAH